MFKTENRVSNGRGIVLRETDAGESGKKLVLLLKTAGKMTVSARGARLPKSKFLAGSQLFTYADFVFYNGSSFTAVSQIDVIEGFARIRSDYDAFCCAAYFAEVCDKFILAGDPCDETLRLLLKSLQALSGGRHSVVFICAVFELKFLQLNGFSPEYDMCEAPMLSKEGGAVFMHILNSAVADVYKFGVPEHVAAALKRASGFFMRTHLDLQLKSRKLLDF